ncbi:uncharacterized protein PITG_00875 [Phytophthora infestans T30-4]|uniref:Uncharacterized protein n=1 Tax=Phytophthora infestans (strain T30-4) TaxID=403677 RepID=D0MRW7_PHYIT|nr:uncharacterized protein PITG_00875 [Phytophthora infestans T30-4]EEY58236.1 hypothetical protein PITG_00875 [Phytophthora infestans T30-4]|eukprot:XP_002909422.1 hypothetical protein PITG_00875 [Phytophthora infestans T30-4]
MEPEWHVCVKELLQFVEVELWLSYYAVTPTFFYHRDNRNYFPPAQSAMPQTRYMAILNALGAQRARSDDSCVEKSDS